MLPTIAFISFFVFLFGFVVFLILLIIQLIRGESIVLPAVGMFVFSVLLLGSAVVNELKDIIIPDTDAPQDQVEDINEGEPSEQEPEPGGETDGNISGDLGSYHVEIKDAFLAKDYEGNPAMVITYAWTNNSDETKSSMFTVLEKAFQDGVQLDTAILMDVEGYEAGTNLREISPETTIDIQCAYKLTSETSVVEFELTELISSSDDMVTADFDPTALG